MLLQQRYGGQMHLEMFLTLFLPVSAEASLSRYACHMGLSCPFSPTDFSGSWTRMEADFCMDWGCVLSLIVCVLCCEELMEQSSSRG